MNPYAIAVLVWLGSLVAVGVWQHHDGYADAEGVWQEREAGINADAAVKIVAANERVRSAEEAHFNAIAKADTQLRDKTNELNAALSAARARGLFNPSGPAPNRDAASPVIPSPCQCDAVPGSRLSDSVTNFLLAEAVRADAIVLQLSACQQILQADRANR